VSLRGLTLRLAQLMVHEPLFLRVLTRRVRRDGARSTSGEIPPILALGHPVNLLSRPGEGSDLVTSCWRERLRGVVRMRAVAVTVAMGLPLVGGGAYAEAHAPAKQPVGPLVWSRPVSIALELTGVSCPSTSLCVAVGFGAAGSGGTYVATEPGGRREAWRFGVVDPGSTLAGVS
jgi:hypothetical protein